MYTLLMNVYRITLTELQSKDALRYLGLKTGLADPAMAALCKTCSKALLSAIDARAVCRIFPYRDGVIEGCTYRPAGRTIRRYRPPTSSGTAAGTRTISVSSTATRPC